MIHGRVGVAHEGDGGVGQHGFPAFASCHGHAETGTGGDLDALQQHPSGDGQSHPLGQVEGGLLVDQALAQDDELVPADASDDVARPRGTHETLADVGDQHVAVFVADGVVDVLQLVDVEEEDGDHLARGPGPFDGLGKFAHEQRAIGKRREAVVSGLVRQSRLELRRRRDVARDESQTIGGASNLHLEGVDVVVGSA